ncbi:MAG: DUF3160 domain-containing protein, partial [Armatimonadetes bacterium]|nr:DUF3160 domain-containing protein [Armatimonadota bacterium]
SKELSKAARTILAKNLFVIVPYKAEQLFYIYTENEQKGRPSFVSVDSALHLWHMAFDYSLRYLERTSLLPKLEKMTQQMLEAAITELGRQHSEFGREVAARVAAYFLVPARLLDLQNLPAVPAEVSRLANEDLSRIRAHAGAARSAVTGWDVEFDLFVPRGHYTRRPEYKRYFLAMSWFGNAYWAFPNVSDERARTSAAAACLTAAMLTDPARKAAAERWNAIYDATCWYVGGGDDNTPVELWAAVEKFFGKRPTVTELLNAETAGRLARHLAEVLRPPLIRRSAGDFAWKNMRFMPTRFVPDSYVMNNLIYDRVGPARDGTKRLLPRGLDVMAALGSPRARRHLTEVYHDDRFSGFLENLTAINRELAEQPRERWVSNMYWGWLWVLAAVLEPKSRGYPSFMVSEAWEDKQLMTALASWAQLRHDTILYAKPAGAEGEGPELPVAKGYVEPDVEAWRRLETLVDLSLRGLRNRGLLPQDSEMASTLSIMHDNISRLRAIAEKELSGKPLSPDDYNFIVSMGSTLEGLQLSLVRSDNIDVTHWGFIEKRAERCMACVADVATGGGECLEAAVGPAYVIYVVCPVEGRPSLLRGPVFSYFEFRQPISRRLTDEQWIGLLTHATGVRLPEWTAGIVTSLDAPRGDWIPAPSGP